MDKMRVIRNPKKVSAPVGGYSHGLEVRSGNRTLYISGQIPEKLNGEVPSDFESQCEVVWNNIREILNESGMSFENLVKVTTYLTNQNQAESNSKIRRWFLGDVKPALTVVIAQTLETGWLLEIEAIAVADD